MSLQSTVCVKFTPRQYMKLYECNLLYVNNTRINTSKALLTSLVDEAAGKWIKTGFGNLTTAVTFPRDKELNYDDDCITN